MILARAVEHQRREGACLSARAWKRGSRRLRTAYFPKTQLAAGPRLPYMVTTLAQCCYLNVLDTPNHTMRRGGLLVSL